MSASVRPSQWQMFCRDAARWIRPQEVGDVGELTLPRLMSLVHRHPPLRVMGWFRFGSALHDRGVRGIPSWVQRRLLRIYGIELSIGATIGGGFYIAHPVGCVLMAEGIGSNVTVISQVTFGTRNDGRWPIIGDDTFFGAGARVLGGISIGQGAQVGANAVVLRDVQPGTTVVGVPARPTLGRVDLER